MGLPARPGPIHQRIGSQVRARVPGRRLGRLAQRGGIAGGPDLQGRLPRRRDADGRAELLATRSPSRGPVLRSRPSRPAGIHRPLEPPADRLHDELSRFRRRDHRQRAVADVVLGRVGDPGELLAQGGDQGDGGEGDFDGVGHIEEGLGEAGGGVGVGGGVAGVAEVDQSSRRVIAVVQLPQQHL